MKPEEDEACVFRIAEGAAFQDRGSKNCEAEDHHGDNVVGAIGDPAQPAVKSGTADEPANERGHHDTVQNCDEVLQAVVVIAIAVVGGGEGQESAVGPEDAGGQPHRESRGRHADGGQDAQLHHEHHGHTRQHHAGGVQVLGSHPAQQLAVDIEGQRRGRVNG